VILIQIYNMIGAKKALDIADILDYIRVANALGMI
jgi:hypothetical protein